MVVGPGLGVPLLGGCDNTSSPIPEPEGPQFSFFPQVDSLNISSTGFIDFRAVSSPAVTFNVAWILNDVAVGVGPNFRFFPPDIGPMTLNAIATYEDNSSSYSWNLEVTNQHLLDFSFEPPESDITLVELENRQFRVYHEWPFTTSYSWYHGGEVVSQDSVYVFTAQVLGPDSLKVEVAADDQVFAMTWHLLVNHYLPPTVEEVLAVDGQMGGSVEVIWHGVVPVVHPVSGYLVAASFDGPITEENWDDALEFGPFEHNSYETWFRHTFNETEHGMIPGAEGWFAVRSVGNLGMLSDISPNVRHLLTGNWWVEGMVTDEQGNALAGVTLVDDGLLYSVLTDAAGEYRIGPFADNQPVVLRTSSPDVDQPGQPGTSWYDYRTGPLYAETEQNLDVALVTRFGADPLCASHEGSFLNYFRYMTRTSLTTNLRPNYRLYKWDSYPLTVYIPEYTGSGGIDFQTNCALTLDMWNTNLGEDIFESVSDPDQADVVFYFADTGNDANGQTSLMLPNDQDYQLGDVVPEKMQVYIHNTLTDTQRIQETSLHELGHVLGLNRHSMCNQPGYLMYVTAAGVLDNGPENAIHLDELRAVATIRHLPHGYDMGGF